MGKARKIILDLVEGFYAQLARAINALLESSSGKKRGSLETESTIPAIGLEKGRRRK